MIISTRTGRNIILLFHCSFCRGIKWNSRFGKLSRLGHMALISTRRRRHRRRISRWRSESRLGTSSARVALF